MEKIIAYHCGPALAGIKPANIVACHKNKISDLYIRLEQLSNQLRSKNIYFEILNENENRVLVMAYNRYVLEKHLKDKEIKKFLALFKYPPTDDLDACISVLKKRMDGAEFPHEIGVFLGYPLHDIYGFINHKNEGCLLCGDWKVYENADEAAELFKQFSDCRRALIKRLSMGQTLPQIFCSV